MSEFDSKFGLTEIQTLEEYMNEIKEKAGLDLKRQVCQKQFVKGKNIKIKYLQEWILINK